MSGQRRKLSFSDNPEVEPRMDDESYVLLLLADGNLPTGSFVASSGLESYIKHGFMSSSSSTNGIMHFIANSLQTYARSALPFVSDAHLVMSEFMKKDMSQEEVITRITELDDMYECMTLNDVARRASKSQGVALLTLHTKGFSKPNTPHSSTIQNGDASTSPSKVGPLIDALKLGIRREDIHGHLPVCWGILTATLGLSLERSQYMFLFLHARSLLSAAVRLNVLGPYASQQLLLHQVRPLVDLQVSRNKHVRTGVKSEGHAVTVFDGPATTWPLGELLAARHDLQHSRIFNS